MDLKALTAEHLEHARDRTWSLLAPLDDDELRRQVSPLMSPLCWDLAHIGHYEELWLLRALFDTTPAEPRYDDLYDAFRHPRRERAALAILDPAGARSYVGDVRTRVLDALERVDLDDGPLRRNAFVYGMVIQHEHQHQETMLATVDLLDRPYQESNGNDGDLRVRPAAPADDVEASLPGATFTMGTDAEPWAYDNERPAHPVDVAPFQIDVTPVSSPA